MSPSQATLRQMASRPELFRQHLLVDTDEGVVPLGEILDPWQREDFEAIDPACLRVVGLQATGPQRAWLERPRGHSKTTDIAVVVCWLMLMSRRQLSGVAAAADRDQAALLRDAIDKLVGLNPWLAKLLYVTKFTVTNRHTGSRLKIISSEAATSYGALPDFVVCDEISHWQSSALWDSLFSSAAKRAECLMIVIGNAGFKTSWVWATREAVRRDPDWYFKALPGPRASWITQDRLDEQERLLPGAAFRRLWLNVWSSGDGDALDEEWIEAALTRKGPMTGEEENFAFVAGLDLGTRRDHSALVVLGCHGPTGRVALANCWSWSPPKGGEINLVEVERKIIAAHRQYRFRLYFDPWQAVRMCQGLQRHGVYSEPVTFTGQSLNKMATALLESFSTYAIDLYNHPRLISDLKRLTIVEKTYGFKLESTRDAVGHADTATAFAIALPFANRRALSGAFASFPTAQRVEKPMRTSVAMNRKWTRVSKPQSDRSLS